jgi:drug/metabolite transporter (DMT)-like permease
VLAAYITVCVVWGSTYLAIRVGVEHVPPALLAGVRFIIAGLILLAFARVTGRPLPRRRSDWVTNVVVGVLLLAVGNGLVVWSEQFVASGAAAIFVVTMTLWLVLFDAVIPGRTSQPTLSQIVGLLVGFGGTLLLVGGDVESLRHADWRGPIGLTVAPMAWALGSVYAKRHPLASGPHVSSGIQMLAAGCVLLILATVAGEWPAWHLTTQGAGAIAYLVVIGSLVGYSCYMYMLKHLSPAVVGTYSYLNTVVAVLLGWAILGEPVTGRTVLAMVLVVGSVMWVRRGRRPAVAAGGRG